MDDLKAATQILEGKVAVIKCEGFVDSVTVNIIEQKIHEAIGKGIFSVVIDLGLVNYVSSAGWGVFVSEIKDIRAKKGDIVLTGMAPEVYDVYELMEFSSILKSFDTLGEACKNFGVKAASDMAAVDPSKGMQKGEQPLAPAAKPVPAKPVEEKKKKGLFGFGR